MLSSLLETQIVIGGETVTYLDIGEGLLYALLGFIITFLGIVILIFMIWAVGKIMSKIRMQKKEVPPDAKEDNLTEENSLTPEIRAAIVAAIAAYYEGEKSVCEFKVKRIRRL